MTIPIRNLYYIFCYAWARFPPGGLGEVGAEDCPDLPNLFARLLIDGMHRLIRRGLDRGYQETIEDTRLPRGRLVLDQIVKEQTLLRGSVVCRYDELKHDMLHNQILKATARALARVDTLLPCYAHELQAVARRLNAVSNIRLSAETFRGVQLSRNNRHYAMLIQLCEFVFWSMLPDERGSGFQFAKVLEDEARMSAVFEDFLRNFYTYEQATFRVSREVMSWDAEPMSLGGLACLPVMETDITLRSPERVIVIDAKYYKEALVKRYGTLKVRAAHLYQLFAYLKHVRLASESTVVDGMLIYPAVGNPFSLEYLISGHKVRVTAVDLNLPWYNIHQILLQALGEFVSLPSAGTPGPRAAMSLNPGAGAC